jgi:hypothetical protein
MGEAVPVAPSARQWPPSRHHWSAGTPVTLSVSPAIAVPSSSVCQLPYLLLKPIGAGPSRAAAYGPGRRLTGCIQHPQSSSAGRRVRSLSPVSV